MIVRIYKPSQKNDVGPLYLIAPEDRFEWENLPTEFDAYLFLYSSYNLFNGN